MSTSGRPKLSVAFIGHVDSGKSTIAGHLLQLCNAVDHATIQKRDAIAESLGKGSSKYAFTLDRLPTERERGLTIDTSMWSLQTSRFAFTLLDTPGHQDYTKNMITGVSLADAAVLVTSAVEDDFKTNMAPGGATREDALIAYTMGIRQIVVAVNKMDHSSVGYDEACFNRLARDLAAFLQRVGFSPERVRIVPVSGWEGANLVEHSENMPWYKGPTFLETLNVLEVPPKPDSSIPLRIPISDVYKVSGVGIVPVGRVATGSLHPEDSVVIAPGNIATSIKSIEMHHTSLSEARPGDFVGFNLKGLSTKGALCRGMVCGPANDPPREALSFVAQIIVLNVTNEITVGFTPVIDIHTAHVACKFVEIISRIDRHTGAELEKNPKCLRNNDAALVRLVPQRPLVVEAFNDCPPLSRFTIRDIHRAVAVGIVKSVKKKPSEGAAAQQEQIQRESPLADVAV